MRLPWGKHKGEDVADVPPGYLVWLLEHAANVTGPLRQAVREEIADRLGLHTAPALEDADKLKQVAARWYRAQALRHHPDRGGDDRVMAALNDLAEALQEALDEASSQLGACA